MTSFGEGKMWDDNKKRRARIPQGVMKQVVARSQGRCESCGTKVQGLHYHIHHKDRDRNNNELSNLRVLCPNCHSKIGVHKSSEPKREKSFDERFNEDMGKLDKVITGQVFGTSNKRKKKSSF
jgi:5-methylcytosine-specific restriction endonuclease McrA